MLMRTEAHPHHRSVPRELNDTNGKRTKTDNGTSLDAPGEQTPTPRWRTEGLEPGQLLIGPPSRPAHTSSIHHTHTHTPPSRWFTLTRWRGLPFSSQQRCIGGEANQEIIKSNEKNSSWWIASILSLEWNNDPITINTRAVKLIKRVEKYPVVKNDGECLKQVFTDQLLEYN